MSSLDSAPTATHSHPAPFPSAELLDKIRGIKELSSTERTILENLVQAHDAKLLALYNGITNSEELQRELVRVAREASATLASSVVQNPTSGRSTSSPPTASIAPMDITETTPASSPRDALQAAFSKLGQAKPEVLRASLKTLLGVLHDVDKNRKLLTKNILYKKNIMDVPGALEMLQSVGYHLIDVAGKQYLELLEHDTNRDAIQTALSLINSRISSGEDAGKKKVVCPGGCGLFGEEKTSNYCASCWEKKNKPQATPKLCVKNCGFFGSTQFEGMCSSCFSKSGKKAAPSSSSSSVNAAAAPKMTSRRRLKRAINVVRAVKRFRISKRKVQEDSTKCWTCKKKIGILGIECKCGYIFCSTHRFPAIHECDFDHARLHKKKLVKENPTLASDKMDKVGN